MEFDAMCVSVTGPIQMQLCSRNGVERALKPGGTGSGRSRDYHPTEGIHIPATATDTLNKLAVIKVDGGN